MTEVLHRRPMLGAKRAVWIPAVLFLLLMLRCCAFGPVYFPQLDDYIQYHNYPSSRSFLALNQAVGLLASRPLAGIADYFVWGRLFPVMICGVALICLGYVACALLLQGLLGRYFQVGPLFLVVFCLLPLGMEGLYWMSASTRIVSGLLLGCLAAAAFAAWLDSGRARWALLYLPLQLLPFGFYEQCAVLSMTLVLGMALLERRRRGARTLLALWTLPALLLYVALLAALAAGNPFASRSQLILPVTPYYWRVLFPQVVKQVAAAFLGGGFCTLFKGFARGVGMLPTPGRLIWLLGVLLCCALLVRVLSSAPQREEGRFRPALPLLAGFLLALAPVTPFFVLGNAWFSLRGTVPSFAGAALMADTLARLLAARLHLDWHRLCPPLCAALALVFSVASLSELSDYQDTYLYDQQVGRAVLQTLRGDPAGPQERVGILNLEPTSLPDQNFYYHEHIHGCTESGWALSGLLTALGGSDLGEVVPLPAQPMYQRWNSRMNRPDCFDRLYLYDGDALVPVRLEPTGPHAFQVYSTAGTLLGSVWEDGEETGYFSPAPAR